MHTIRLRGPWQLEPLARFVRQADGTYHSEAGDLPSETRATMPADWSASFGADFLGRVRYHRVFQKPTGLESGERVFLVVEPPCTHGTIRLGGFELGEVDQAGAPGRFEITQQLEDNNRLEIIVKHPTLGSDSSRIGGLVGDVRLEIEE